ncbi:MAG: GNAT family N-acetyltransferase, partial [Myxococcota bacterium]
VDARFGWPSPRDLTIEHIAVLRALRGQGRGRALVGAALDVAQSRFGEVDQLYAAVLQAHGSAAVFWRNLGLCPVGSDPCVFSGPANPLLPERTQRHEDMRR